MGIEFSTRMFDGMNFPSDACACPSGISCGRAPAPHVKIGGHAPALIPGSLPTPAADDTG